MRQLIQQSALPVLNLDVSNSDVSAAAETIAAWLEQTGGLSM